jgi:NADH:ubiquinone oxidoreductase subunit F (NADH-binding)/(2Fe-2S) ferredoxin/NAD-dependent dihydropyrimidine dehydrogenase PreA subunit
MKFKTVKNLQKYSAKAKAKRETFTRHVFVCAGPGCLARGGLDIVQALRDELAKRKADLTKKGIKVGVNLGVTETGCHGLCEAGPLVTFEPDKLFYTHVAVKDIPEIVETTILGGKTIPRLLYHVSGNGKGIAKYTDIPFYSNQTRVALKNVGTIDPKSLDDYLAIGGFSAFCKALTTMPPDKVVDAVDKSKLRGRGGGGFLTGKKWKSCLKAGGDVRYLICNGDEGDPGAFMDRAIMEGDPFAVLEGMMIGAYALRSDKAYIYVRNEYPLAVKHLQIAIDKLKEAGLLGERILGTDFSLNIQINRGGGAFVCGESSALMRSLEGKVGEPRAKYVHSVVAGLYDKPTVLNNVETWTCVVAIINNGANWFAKIGAEKSSGTKAFSLVGKVKNTGLIEVPMGTSIRHIIYDLGGGIINDRPFKAVQTGGPSGGCLPEAKLDLPVDFDTLTQVGSMMGSGGMIVMDDRTCMVDVAKYFVHFLIEESCGKCVPCREGLRQLDIMLDRVVHGDGDESLLGEIERLSDAMKLGSLCGLGQSAPNPVMSTLTYFRDEYLAHLKEKRCPAGVCKPLITYFINDECTGCMVCARNCPVECITGEKNKLHVIDSDVCTRCGICLAVCKFDAVEVH